MLAMSKPLIDKKYNHEIVADNASTFEQHSNYLKQMLIVINHHLL